MAAYNQALGMWRASNGGYYGTREEAEAVERGDAAPSMSTPDRLDSNLAEGSTMGVRGPQISDEQLDLERQQALRLSQEQGGRARSEAAQTADQRYRLQTGDLEGLLPAQREQAAGAFLDNAAADPYHPSHDYASQLGYVTSAGYQGGVEQLNFTPPPAPATAPVTRTDERHDAAARETGDARQTFEREDAENQQQNADAWSRAWQEFDNLEATDYGMSDEARGYQREGLQQQRELLERMLGFDPNQYATQFADQALARQVALGRSQGTTAAAQQAGTFAAMEQAPALYAEGARQAAQIEAQRLNQAASVARSFGELGTMTRGQDEQRAQFESTLAVNIANSVANLSQGQVQLNQQESQMFAEMWMDFARLQSVYAGMSSAEQIAWWQTEAQKRGQDKQFEAVMANIRAQGAVDDKDVMDALFGLGGDLLGIAGRLGMGGA